MPKSIRFVINITIIKLEKKKLNINNPLLIE